MKLSLRNAPGAGVAAAFRRWAGALALALAGAPCALAAGTLLDGAGAHPPMKGQAPKHSDVVFSTRFERPEALPVIQAYGATRVEWVYASRQDYVREVRSRVGWFGGTINANPRLPDDAGYVRDFDGTVLAAPWMPGWGVYWVTTTHPATQRVMAEQVARYLDMGVDSLQFDDPQLQVFAALRQGGDFNPSTVIGFPAWLARHDDPARVRAAGLAGFDGDYKRFLQQKHQVTNAADYRARFTSFPSTPLWLDYMRSTVLDHFRRVAQSAAERRGQRLPISMNLALTEPLDSSPFMFLAPVADYAMAETPIKDEAIAMSAAATLRALGIGFVPSLRPLGTAENRVAIATFYAVGGVPVVPWDVYDGNDEQGKAKRFFGKPEDYADLYKFVRSHGALFDGAETAALVGLVVPVAAGTATELHALVRRLTARQIPFTYLPVGGAARHQLDPALLKRLGLLVTTGADSAYAAEHSALLAASGVRRIGVASLSDAVLDEFRPFLVSPGAERLRLLPRADPRARDRLFVHVIDQARGADGAGAADCQRRIGIRRDLLGAKVASATWHAPGAAESRPAFADADRQHDFFSVETCPMWGVLELRLQP